MKLLILVVLVAMSLVACKKEVKPETVKADAVQKAVSSVKK